MCVWCRTELGFENVRADGKGAFLEELGGVVKTTTEGLLFSFQCLKG